MKPLTLFQSRNRGSFDFKESQSQPIRLLQFLFQSRNRGSFDFKRRDRLGSVRVGQCFNLVIEVLLISRSWWNCVANFKLCVSMFQSRNRGSFDFKEKSENVNSQIYAFQSRNRGSFDFKLDIPPSALEFEQSFNLVIEVLLISRMVKSKPYVLVGIVSIS